MAIAAAINADGKARAWPDPPQTPLFHVHVQAGKAALERARGAGLRVRPVGTGSRPSSYEVSVGQNAMDFAPDEVVDLIRQLLDRVRE